MGGMEAVKSKEEILEEMGLNIRRLMTGLLLEVTAEELEETASSVLKKARNRTTAKPQLKTMLSGYGSGSDSQSDSGSDGDSDEDLESVLRKKKKQFVKTESKILDFCAEAAARRRRDVSQGAKIPRQVQQEGATMEGPRK